MAQPIEGVVAKPPDFKITEELGKNGHVLLVEKVRLDTINELESAGFNICFGICPGAANEKKIIM